MDVEIPDLVMTSVPTCWSIHDLDSTSIWMSPFPVVLMCDWSRKKVVPSLSFLSWSQWSSIRGGSLTLDGGELLSHDDYVCLLPYKFMVSVVF